MNTSFMLLALYDGLPIVPIDKVCADFFTHLTVPKLVAKIDRGEIKLPMIRIERSNKAARGVHIADLAAWIHERRAAAQRELKQLTE